MVPQPCEDIRENNEEEEENNDLNFDKKIQ